VVNFAQGEFVMLGGMATIFLGYAGVPPPLAALLAVLMTTAIGLALYRFGIAPARDASAVTLIIITIGASIFLRGMAEIIFDKSFHSLPAVFGNDPIRIGGASILPQTAVVLASVLLIVCLLSAFIGRTLYGKAVVATSSNRMAATLVGINTQTMVGICFAISAAIGGIAGVLITPITLTSYNVGALLALKGFAAIMLGGIGSAVGAVVGGVLLGLFEAFAAGYLSASYKDAVAFTVILAVLFVMPQGLFGKRMVERV
jgi:branched-chain amino acid transport system permease protein